MPSLLSLNVMDDGRRRHPPPPQVRLVLAMVLFHCLGALRLGQSQNPRLRTTPPENEFVPLRTGRVPHRSS